MTNNLDNTLKAIGADWAHKIYSKSRHYIEIDIGKKGRELGYSEIEKKYRKVLAVVPLKDVEHGMKVRIDGRTFVNYAQLTSGVAIPGRVIEESSLDHKAFVANNSMILNFI